MNQIFQAYGKRYNPDSLEYPWAYKREDVRWLAFERWVDSHATKYDSSDNDKHRYQCYSSASYTAASYRNPREGTKGSPKEDDFDNFAMSLCRLKGKDTVIVMRTMMKCRSTNHRRTA